MSARQSSAPGGSGALSDGNALVSTHLVVTQACCCCEHLRRTFRFAGKSEACQA